MSGVENSEEFRRFVADMKADIKAGRTTPHQSSVNNGKCHCQLITQYIMNIHRNVLLNVRAPHGNISYFRLSFLSPPQSYGYIRSTVTKVYVHVYYRCEYR